MDVKAESMKRIISKIALPASYICVDTAIRDKGSNAPSNVIEYFIRYVADGVVQTEHDFTWKSQTASRDDLVKLALQVNGMLKRKCLFCEATRGTESLTRSCLAKLVSSILVQHGNSHCDLKRVEQLMAQYLPASEEYVAPIFFDTQPDPADQIFCKKPNEQNDPAGRVYQPIAAMTDINSALFRPNGDLTTCCTGSNSRRLGRSRCQV